MSEVKRGLSFFLALVILLGSMTSLVSAMPGIDDRSLGYQLLNSGLAYKEGNFFIVPYNEKLEDNIKDQFLSEDESAILYEASSSESSLVFPDIGDFILKESVFLPENKEVVLPENIVRVGDMPEAERVLYYNEALERGAGNFELVIDSSGEEEVAINEENPLLIINDQAANRFEEIKDTLLVSDELDPEPVGAAEKPAFNEDGHPLKTIRVKAEFIEDYVKKPEDRVSPEEVEGITLSLFEQNEALGIFSDSVYRNHKKLATEAINPQSLEFVFNEYINPDKTYFIMIDSGNQFYRGYPWSKDSYNNHYRITYSPEAIILKGLDIEDDHSETYDIVMNNSDDRDDVTRYQIEMRVQNASGENVYGASYGLYSLDGKLIERSKTIPPKTFSGYETIIFVADFVDSDSEYLPCYIEEFPVSPYGYKPDNNRYMVSKTGAQDRHTTSSRDYYHKIYYKHIDLAPVIRVKDKSPDVIDNAPKNNELGEYSARVFDKNTGIPIGGLSFDLYNKDDELISQRKTSPFGYLVFAGPVIDNGSYYIKPTKTDGSLFDDQNIPISFNTDLSYYVGGSSLKKATYGESGEESPYQKIYLNSKDNEYVPKFPHAICFEVSENIGGNKNVPVGGIPFGLFNSNDDLISKTESQYNGLVCFKEDLPVGKEDYSVKILKETQNYSKNEIIFDLDFSKDIDSSDYDYGNSFKGLFYSGRAILVDKGGFTVTTGSSDLNPVDRGMITVFIDDEYESAGKIDNLEFALFDSEENEIQRKPYSNFGIVRFFINSVEKGDSYTIRSYGSGLPEEGDLVYSSSFYSNDGEKFYDEARYFLPISSEVVGDDNYIVNIRYYDKGTGKRIADPDEMYFRVYEEDGGLLSYEEELEPGKRYFLSLISGNPKYEYFKEKLWFSSDDAILSEDGKTKVFNFDVFLAPSSERLVFSTINLELDYIYNLIRKQDVYIKPYPVFVLEGNDEKTEGIYVSWNSYFGSLYGYYPVGNYKLKIIYPEPFKTIVLDAYIMDSYLTELVDADEDKEAYIESVSNWTPYFDDLGPINSRDLQGKYGKGFSNPLSSLSDVVNFGPGRMVVGRDISFYVNPHLIDFPIHKLGLGKNDEEIGGVESTFEVYRLDFDGSIEEYTKKIVETNENGDAMIEDLLVASNYVLREVSTDPVYNLNEKQIYFHVTGHGQVFVYKDSIDPPKYLPSEISSLPFKGFGSLFSGWNIKRVYHSDPTSDGLLYPYRGDSRLVNSYDTTLPHGLLEESINKIVFTNKQKQGTILLKKYGDNKELLAGAKFELYKGEDLIDTGITNKDGILEFNSLTMGDYIVREVESPNGYILSGEDITITLADEEVVEVEVDNEKAELPVTGSVEVFAIMLAGSFFLLTFKRKKTIVR